MKEIAQAKFENALEDIWTLSQELGKHFELNSIQYAHSEVIKQRVKEIQDLVEWI